MSPAVRRVWERADMLVKEASHDQVVNRSVGREPPGDKSPTNSHRPPGQCPSRLPQNLRIPWRSILGDAISVGRAIRFSSSEEA